MNIRKKASEPPFNRLSDTAAMPSIFRVPVAW